MTAYNICSDLATVEVLHQGKVVLIQREQNPATVLNAEYAQTARKCPPYCIQPMSLAPGVETLGELEILSYLSRIFHGKNNFLVIDSRTPDWFVKGTIPGSINIPFAQNMEGQPTDLDSIHTTFTMQFNVCGSRTSYDFSQAHTLAIFCNGPWCGQTPNFIRALINLGYPSDKLKWYRGGMQDWCSLGLSTI